MLNFACHVGNLTPGPSLYLFDVSSATKKQKLQEDYYSPLVSFVAFHCSQGHSFLRISLVKRMSGASRNQTSGFFPSIDMCKISYANFKDLPMRTCSSAVKTLKMRHFGMDDSVFQSSKWKQRESWLA